MTASFLFFFCSGLCTTWKLNRRGIRVVKAGRKKSVVQHVDYMHRKVWSNCKTVTRCEFDFNLTLYVLMLPYTKFFLFIFFSFFTSCAKHSKFTTSMTRMNPMNKNLAIKKQKKGAVHVSRLQLQTPKSLITSCAPIINLQSALCSYHSAQFEINLSPHCAGMDLTFESNGGIEAARECSSVVPVRSIVQ